MSLSLIKTMNQIMGRELWRTHSYIIIRRDRFIEEIKER